MSDWRASAKERLKEKKSGAAFKLIEGNNGFRTLPNRKDLLPDGRPRPEGFKHPPFLELRVHRDVGPDKAFLRCGKDIDGHGKCWLCDVKIPELEASKNPAKKEQAFTIGPRENFLIQVSRVDEETKKFSLPKPFWVSNGKGIPGRPAKRPTLATQVMAAILNSKKDFVDPAKGYNMYISRSGMGPRDTIYDPPVGDESPSKVPLSVLAAVKPFEELVAQYDSEEQKSAYFGRPRRDEDQDRDRGPRRRGREEEESYGDASQEADENAEYGEELPAEGEPEPEYGEEPEQELEYGEEAGWEPPETESEYGEPEGEAAVDEAADEYGADEPEMEPEPEPEPPRRRVPPAGRQHPGPKAGPKTSGKGVNKKPIPRRK